MLNVTQNNNVIIRTYSSNIWWLKIHRKVQYRMSEDRRIKFSIVYRWSERYERKREQLYNYNNSLGYFVNKCSISTGYCQKIIDIQSTG